MATPLDDIKEEVTSKTNAALVKTAERLGKEVGEDFKTAIKNFYSDYTPRSYKRTRSLYKLAKGAGGREKYYRTVGNNECVFGVLVDPSYIPGNPYKKDPPHGWDFGPQDAFDYPYLKGVHGFTLSYVNRYKDRFYTTNEFGRTVSRVPGFSRRSIPRSTTGYFRAGMKREIRGGRPDNMMKAYFEKYTFYYCEGVFNEILGSLL